MKRTLHQSLLAFVTVLSILTPSLVDAATVLTPGGQTVYVCEYTDNMTSLEKAQLAANILTIFPNVTILAPATPEYNCHCYAWHMTEGHLSQKYWMNPSHNDQPNLSKYWTNDHFVATSGNLYDKIVYSQVSNPTNDSFYTHSAVVSSVSGYYESKWGSWPLVRHLPNDVPPEYGNFKHYFKPIPPTPVYGPLVCQYNTATINRNVDADYYSSLSSPFTYYRIEICDQKGEDAIDNGKAVVNNIFNCGANITFSRAGDYDITIWFYNKYNELMGKFTYQQIVV